MSKDPQDGGKVPGGTILRHAQDDVRVQIVDPRRRGSEQSIESGAVPPGAIRQPERSAIQSSPFRNGVERALSADGLMRSGADAPDSSGLGGVRSIAREMQQFLADRTDMSYASPYQKESPMSDRQAAPTAAARPPRKRGSRGSKNSGARSTVGAPDEARRGCVAHVAREIRRKALETFNPRPDLPRPWTPVPNQPPTVARRRRPRFGAFSRASRKEDAFSIGTAAAHGKQRDALNAARDEGAASGRLVPAGGDRPGNPLQSLDNARFASGIFGRAVGTASDMAFSSARRFRSASPARDGSAGRSRRRYFVPNIRSPASPSPGTIYP